MQKKRRKPNSANPVAVLMTRALIHYAADLGSKGHLDLAMLGAAFRPIEPARPSNRSPTPDYKPHDLLTPDEAASILNQSPKTLANKRTIGNGPPYTKLNGRAIRYEYKALMDFARSGSRISTSEPVAKEGASVKNKEPKASSITTTSRKAISEKKSGSRKPSKRRRGKRNQQDSRGKK